MKRHTLGMRDDRGFTLVELLIFIIALGILAAIVVFAIGSTRNDAVAASCKTYVKAVEFSAEAVHTRLESYPAGDLDNDGPGADTATGFINGNPAAVGGANASVLLAPSSGALLKEWPTVSSSSDYFLQYQYLPATSRFQVNVYPKGGTQNADGSITSTDAGYAAAGVGTAGCEAL